MSTSIFGCPAPEDQLMHQHFDVADPPDPGLEDPGFSVGAGPVELERTTAGGHNLQRAALR